MGSGRIVFLGVKGVRAGKGALASAEMEELGKSRCPGGMGLRRCPWGLVGQGGLAPLTPLVSVLVLMASHPFFFSLSRYPVCEAAIEPSVKCRILVMGSASPANR